MILADKAAEVLLKSHKLFNQTQTLQVASDNEIEVLDHTSQQAWNKVLIDVKC